MIGLGILTFNRLEYFKQVIATIPFDKIQHCVIVNDGMAYPTDIIPKDAVLIQHTSNKGIGKSKNEALQYLLNKGCEDLFLIEDDILIKDPNVFNEYIRTAKKTGLFHLNFEQVGANLLQLKVAYDDETTIALYKNPQGAFGYYYRNVLEKLGLLDEGFINAFEHVDYVYRLSQVGLLPPFWFFPDINNSEKYLEPILGSIESSTITNKANYQDNWHNSAHRFIELHGRFTNEIPILHQEKILSSLTKIYNEFGDKR